MESKHGNQRFWASDHFSRMGFELVDFMRPKMVAYVTGMAYGSRLPTLFAVRNSRTKEVRLFTDEVLTRGVRK